MSLWVVPELALAGLGVTAALVWLILLARLIGGVHQRSLGPPHSTFSRTVAAVVPMRNEETNTAECLRSLQMQDSIMRVIAVDDGSSDRTYEILSSFAANDKRINAVRVEAVPKGWVGKSYACQVGADLAGDAEWLLFVDADTRLASGALARALSRAEERGLDALSLLGRLRCPSVWAKLATPFYFGLLNALFPPRDINDKVRGRAYFVGSFILIRRRKYLEIGGHAAVAGDIVEDKALGKLAKDKGLRIGLELSPDCISTEWAPGFKNSVNALMRVVTPPMRNRAGLGAGYSLAFTILFVMPLLTAPVGVWMVSKGFAIGAPILLLGASLVSLEFAFALISVVRFSTVAAPLALGFIPASVVMAVALWQSVFKAWLKKPVVWRGREYT